MLVFASAVKYQRIATNAGMRQRQSVSLRPQTRWQRITQAREERGLSLRALSRKAGIDKSGVTLMHIESGDTPEMAAFVLMQICDALHVRAEWIWWGTGPMDRADSRPPDETGEREAMLVEAIRNQARKPGRPHQK